MLLINKTEYIEHTIIDSPQWKLCCNKNLLICLIIDDETSTFQVKHKPQSMYAEIAIILQTGIESKTQNYW